MTDEADHVEGFSIRPLSQEDRPHWQEIWDGYNEFYGRSGSTALDPEVSSATWRRFFDPYEPMHALVAEAEGKLLGLAHYLYHRSTTALHPNCYLQDLFTNKWARRRGVGASLIEAVYAAAARDGCPRVYWQTHESNHIAMRLYDTVAEKSGFVVYRKLL